MTYRHRWIGRCPAKCPQEINYSWGPTQCEMDEGHEGWHRINFVTQGQLRESLTWDEWDA